MISHARPEFHKGTRSRKRFDVYQKHQILKEEQWKFDKEIKSLKDSLKTIQKEIDSSEDEERTLLLKRTETQTSLRIEDYKEKVHLIKGHLKSCYQIYEAFFDGLRIAFRIDNKFISRHPQNYRAVEGLVALAFDLLRWTLFDLDRAVDNIKAMSRQCLLSAYRTEPIKIPDRPNLFKYFKGNLEDECKNNKGLLTFAGIVRGLPAPNSSSGVLERALRSHRELMEKGSHKKSPVNIEILQDLERFSFKMTQIGLKQVPNELRKPVFKPTLQDKGCFERNRVDGGLYDEIRDRINKLSERELREFLPAFRQYRESEQHSDHLPLLT
jgi:hypothetical protein